MSLLRWNEERYRLVQIRHEIDRIWAAYEGDLQTAEAASAAPNELDEVLASIRTETEHLEDEYAAVVSTRMLQAAARYGVPIPVPSEAADLWVWSRYKRKHLLTTKGIAHLRREIALERDMRHRPWLSWGGFALSLISLCVATFAALH